MTGRLAVLCCLLLLPLSAAAAINNPDETPHFDSGISVWLNSSLLYGSYGSGTEYSPAGNLLSGRLTVNLRISPWFSFSAGGSLGTTLPATLPSLIPGVTNRQIQQLDFDTLYGGMTVTAPAHDTWLFTVRFLVGRVFASYSSTQNNPLPVTSSAGRGNLFTFDIGLTFFLNRSCTFGWEFGFSYNYLNLELDRIVYSVSGDPLRQNVSAQFFGFYSGFTLKL